MGHEAVPEVLLSLNDLWQLFKFLREGEEESISDASLSQHCQGSPVAQKPAAFSDATVNLVVVVAVEFENRCIGSEGELCDGQRSLSSCPRPALPCPLTSPVMFTSLHWVVVGLGALDLPMLCAPARTHRALDALVNPICVNLIASSASC